MMKADYGTYSNTWLIVGLLGGAAVLGGLALLPVPPWARAILGVLALLRGALRPGGAFAFQDPFGMKAIYGDPDALMATLRAGGLTLLEFVPLADVVHIPLLLRPISMDSGILYEVE